MTVADRTVSIPVDVHGAVVLRGEHGLVRLRGSGSTVAIIFDDGATALRWMRAGLSSSRSKFLTRWAARFDLQLEIVVGRRRLARRSPRGRWRPTWPSEVPVR